MSDGAVGTVVGGPTASYMYQIGDLQPERYVFLSQIRRQSHRFEVQYRQRALSPDDGAGFLEDLLERGGVDATTQATRIMRSKARQSTARPELNTIVQQAVAAQLPNFSKLAQFEDAPSSPIFEAIPW